MHAAGRTHIVWLDAVAMVCGRTFDHETGTWGDTIRIGDGCDNHANPCITMDQHGFLHLTYGPHAWCGEWNQGRIKYMVSREPHSLQDWAEAQDFGYNATAGNILNTPQGINVLVCRGGERPAQTVFHRQRLQGGWSSAKPLFAQEIEPQYTHNYGQLCCDQAGNIFVACHFYNVGGGDNQPVNGERCRMRSYGAAVLRSADLGETWTSMNGEPITTPTLYSAGIAIPPAGEDIFVRSIACAPDGSLWAMTMPRLATASAPLWLSHWEKSGWHTVDVSSLLPSGLVALDGIMTWDTGLRLHLALTLAPAPEPGKTLDWGETAGEVFHLCLDSQVQVLACSQISTPDPETPNWLPMISRHGPFQPVRNPVILYTHGAGGNGCRPADNTEVWCVPVFINN